MQASVSQHALVRVARAGDGELGHEVRAGQGGARGDIEVPDVAAERLDERTEGQPPLLDIQTAAHRRDRPLGRARTGRTAGPASRSRRSRQRQAEAGASGYRPYVTRRPGA